MDMLSCRAGALSALLILFVASAGWAQASQDEILIGGNFSVAIQHADACAETVSVDVDPIEIEIDDVTPPQDPSRWRRYRPGMPRFGQARLMFAAEQDDCAEQLAKWILDVAQRGTAAARQIEIALYDSAGNVARRYVIHGAIAMGLAPAGGLNVGLTSSRHLSAANLRELQVEIGRIEITPGDSGNNRGHRRRQDEFVRNYGFRVEFTPGGEPAAADGPWRSVSGGSAVLDTVFKTDPIEGKPTYVPGKAYVSDIILTGYATANRKSLLTWFQNAINGQGQLRADLAITPVKIDGAGGPAHEYYDVLLRRIEIPRLSAGSAEPVREVVVLKPERYNDPK